jgi:hypothetical protein
LVSFLGMASMCACIFHTEIANCNYNPRLAARRSDDSSCCESCTCIAAVGYRVAHVNPIHLMLATVPDETCCSVD